MIMRLYRRHDLDLLYLYQIKGFSLQRAIKSAAYAYINKTGERMPVPDFDIRKASIPAYAQFHVCLSDTHDAELIALIRSINSGYRNSFFKSILRNYLEGPIIDPYVFKDIQLIRADAPQSPKPDKAINPTPQPTFEHNTFPVADVRNSNLAAAVLHAELPQADPNARYIEADKVLQPQNTGNDDDNFDILGEFDGLMGSWES